MTGLEIGAAGAAVFKGVGAAEKALGGGEPEKALIRDLARESLGARAAADAMGDRMAMKQFMINKLLGPLFKFSGYREGYFKSGKFAEDLASKMSGVPEENLISPAPNVAVQAMEGLSFSLDEPDLKEMYLNLLATASDNRRADKAHPSYAGLIRQLSAEEAELLPLFLAEPAGVPMAEIQLNLVSGATRSGFRTVARHVVDWIDHDTGGLAEVPDWPVYVDNWNRLGLVNATYQKWRSAENAYDYVKMRPEYTRQPLPASEDETFELGVQGGLLIPTDFGMRFGKAIEGNSEATE